MSAISPTTDRKITPVGLAHLFAIYTIWSSTYLAIRIAVQPGSGFPPFMFGMTRVVCAAAILLIWAKLSGQRLKPTRHELKILAISGVLLWTGGNGLLTWAEQHTDSGLAALLIAAIPIWAAIIEAIVDRRWPSWRLMGALLLGFVGIALLAAPTLLNGVRADFLSLIALIFAPICWASGSVLQARNPLELAPRVSASYQMLAGGIGFLTLVLVFGEPAPTPTPAAWSAWLYLVIFGAVIAFTSYVTALQTLPTNVVMTYAYVNPVLAVVLGWLILDEKLTSWTFGGMVLVLLGVAGVFNERYNKRPTTNSAN